MAKAQTQVLYEPKLDNIFMVEKAIIDCKEYPTRTELWKSIPRKMQYQTYKRILDYLEASGKMPSTADESFTPESTTSNWKPC